MLLDDFASMVSVESRQQLLSQAVRFTKRLGFDFVNVIAVVDGVDDEHLFLSVDNAPSQAREYQDDRDVHRGDPVMQHIKRSHVPIAWGRDTYLRAERGARWEQQARWGYVAGVALATHLPNGRHFVVGVDRDQPLPRHAGEVTRMVADLQLFAACAQDAAMRVILAEEALDERGVLTPRELEALRWTMEGKTAWELGRILGISEQTAARHISNSMHKLGCVNKMQAVMKALRLGLIN